jgi:hypothetical protein
MFRLEEVMAQQETNFPASDEDDDKSSATIAKTSSSAKQQRSRRRLNSQAKLRRRSVMAAAAAVWKAPGGNWIAPIPTRLSSLPQSSCTPSKSSYHHHVQEREIALDDDFQLQRHDIVCGPLCSKETSRQHPGNARFRVIIEMRSDRYRKATSRSGKTQLVKEVVEIVRISGARFVKQERDGSWFDIGNLKAREKVGRTLRAALQRVPGLQQRQTYSSSSSTDSDPTHPHAAVGSAGADISTVVLEQVPSSSVVAAADQHSPQLSSLHSSALAEFSRFCYQPDQHHYLTTTPFMKHPSNADTKPPPLLQGWQQRHDVHDDLFPDPISRGTTSHGPCLPDGFHGFVRSIFLGSDER